MSDQMQDNIEHLDEIDGMLGDIESLLSVRSSLGRKGPVRGELREARLTLQLTTDLLRQDYGQMARARDAAANLLTTLRDATRGYTRPDMEPLMLRHDEKIAINKAIALLQGGEDDA